MTEVGGLGYKDSLMTNLVSTNKPPSPTNISRQFTVMGWGKQKGRQSFPGVSFLLWLPPPAADC